MPTPFFAFTLDHIVQNALPHGRVMKNELDKGDFIILRTVRSEYTLRVLDGGLVEARGGWFDIKGTAPMVIGVSGATWGGSAIMPGVFAACGMRVEFRNRLVTSPVRSIVVWPARLGN